VHILYMSKLFLLSSLDIVTFLRNDKEFPNVTDARSSIADYYVTLFH